MRSVEWGVLSVSTHYRLRVSDPLSRIASVSLRAIASRDADRAAAAARELGFQRSYGSYADLLADDTIEAVYIPLPNHMHLEWIARAAEAGKHVLCEKPIGLNAREAEEAAEVCDKRGVKLMEAFMYRFHPQWVRARRLMEIGEIGSVNAIHTSFSYKNSDPTNIRNILDVGGGALLDIGCYAVSAARFLMRREPLRVAAQVTRDPQFGTDILSSGILDFGDARSLFTVGTQTFAHQEVVALGSSGTLTVRLPFNAFPDVPLAVDVDTGVGPRRYMAGPADQYGLMFEAFNRAIVEDGPVPTPASDAVNNMKVLDALFASEKSGGWVEVA